MAGVSGNTRSALNSLRIVISEMRRNLLNGSKVRNQPLTKYILQEFRRHETTTQQHCKAAVEMEHLTNTYATYLVSQRKWHKVHTEYHARGERSVAETAKIVGFQLPHDLK